MGLLLALSLCYGLAIANLWRAAGIGRLVRPWRTAAFGLGVTVLAIALLSPVDALGGALFSAHMAQHVLLMMAAAPLLALGAPEYIWLWVLPLQVRRGLALWWIGRRYLGGFAYLMALPLTVWLVSALTLWLWHVPRFYEAALADDATTAAWGMTPLEDQQLAGVIMWVPAGTIYLAAALAILGSRLADLDRQAEPRSQKYS